MIHIKISTDGAAFTDAEGIRSTFFKNMEVARILKKLADQIEQNPDTDWNSISLFDENGNFVGNYDAFED